MTVFKNTKQLTWCDGCGNYGIFNALRFALNDVNVDPQNSLLCFDIGCNGNMSDKIEGFCVHTLHGRVLPISIGAKLARKSLEIIAIAGDGATYAEGIGHFVHSIRNNYPMIFIVHDNSNYGLTTGQCSPTSNWESFSNSNPHGNSGNIFNPLTFALNLNCSFIAQGYSGDIDGLREIFGLAIENTRKNNSFSFVNVLQSCPTYNKVDTDEFYISNATNYISDSYKFSSNLLKNSFHDETNYAESLNLGIKNREFVGILYRKPENNEPNFFDKVNFDTILSARNHSGYDF